MRTTVDIDPELLRRLRNEAHRKREPFKQVLNRVLRRGLESRPASAGRYRCPTFSLGPAAPGARLDKALGIAAALEDEEITRELELRT